MRSSFRSQPRPSAASSTIRPIGQPPVRTLIEPMGGKLASYDFMFGEDDGIVIFAVPDSRAAAAVSLAISSTGAFSRVHTHELIPAENVQSVLDAARTARSSYRPPGG